MKKKVRKLSAFLLASIILLQDISPVLAQNDDSYKTESIMSQSIDEDDLEYENSSEKESETVIDTGDDLENGQYKILSYPKTDYRLGDKIDLTGLEIEAKTYDGELYIYTDEDIKNLTNLQGKDLSNYYYDDLFNDAYIKDESDEFKEELSKYISENKLEKPNDKLTIDLEDFDPVNIDIDVQREDLNLAPKDLFNALKLEKESMMLLNVDRLSYIEGEEIDFDNLQVLGKDADGNLSIYNLDDLDVDTSDLEQAINERSNQKAKTKENLTSFVKIKKDGYQDLYLPITISSNKESLQSLDDKNNIDMLYEAFKLDDKNSIYTLSLDVKNLTDLKDIKVDFKNKDIEIDRIVKSNYDKEEDLSLTDPKYRNIKEEDLEKASDYKIQNPIYFSKDLEAGYKYVIFIKAKTDEALKVKLESNTYTQKDEKEIEIKPTEISATDKANNFVIYVAKGVYTTVGVDGTFVLKDRNTGEIKYRQDSVNKTVTFPQVQTGSYIFYQESSSESGKNPSHDVYYVTIGGTTQKMSLTKTTNETWQGTDNNSSSGQTDGQESGGTRDTTTNSKYKEITLKSFFTPPATIRVKNVKTGLIKSYEATSSPLTINDLEDGEYYIYVYEQKDPNLIPPKTVYKYTIGNDIQIDTLNVDDLNLEQVLPSDKLDKKIQFIAGVGSTFRLRNLSTNQDIEYKIDKSPYTISNLADGEYYLWQYSSGKDNTNPSDIVTKYIVDKNGAKRIEDLSASQLNLPQEKISPQSSADKTWIDSSAPIEFGNMINSNPGYFDRELTTTGKITVKKNFLGEDNNPLKEGEYPDLYFELYKNDQPTGQRKKYEPGKDIVFDITEGEGVDNSSEYTIKEVNADGSLWEHGNFISEVKGTTPVVEKEDTMFERDELESENVIGSYKAKDGNDYVLIRDENGKEIEAICLNPRLDSPGAWGSDVRYKEVDLEEAYDLADSPMVSKGNFTKAMKQVVAYIYKNYDRFVVEDFQTHDTTYSQNITANHDKNHQIYVLIQFAMFYLTNGRSDAEDYIYSKDPTTGIENGLALRFTMSHAEYDRYYRDKVLDIVNNYSSVPENEYKRVDFKLYSPQEKGPALTYQDGGYVYDDSGNIQYVEYQNIFTYTIDSSNIKWSKEYTFTNTAKKNFEIVKKDAADGSVLPGAVFGLYDKDNNLIRQATTDDEGKIVFKGLDNGEYILKEITPPAGYRKEEKTSKITVNGEFTKWENEGLVSNSLQSGVKTKTTDVIYGSNESKKSFHNAMSYAESKDPINNNEVLFHLYLKPVSDEGLSGSGTNKRSGVVLDVDNLDIKDISIYDVDPINRPSVYAAMTGQTIGEDLKLSDGSTLLDKKIVFNSNGKDDNNHPIHITDRAVELSGDRVIDFPDDRFENDWGFLVTVKADIQDVTKESSITYQFKATSGPNLNLNSPIDDQTTTFNAYFGKGELLKPSLTVNNSKDQLASFTINKKDPEGNPLKGAEFSLTDSSGNEVAKATSANDGKITFSDLGNGEYKLKETKAPEGYKLDDKYEWNISVKDGKVSISADESGFYTINDNNTNKTSIDITNEKQKQAKKGKIRLVKTDEDQTPLEGVEFKLIKKDTKEEIATKTTNAQGEIVFENLDQGTYILRETKTKEGYILHDDVEVVVKEDFTISDNDSPRDLSDQIKLELIDWGSSRGSKPSKVYPNNVDSLYVYNKYTFPESIKSGDYFYLDFTNYYEPTGIVKGTGQNYDILGPNGLLAKGVYDEENNRIKYTFTDYVNYYDVKEVDHYLSLFINRYNIANNSRLFIKEKVGDESNEVRSEEFLVDYGDIWAYRDDMSVGSFITDIDLDNKTYTQYVYVNPQGNTITNNTKLDVYSYSPDYNGSSAYFTEDDLENIEVYLVDPNSLPSSFGIGENLLTNPIDKTPNYWEVSDDTYSYEWVNNQEGKGIHLDMGTVFKSGKVAIVKVNGHFEDDGQGMNTTVEFYGGRYGTKVYWDNFNELYYNFGQGSGELKPEDELIVNVDLVNKANRIEFTKVGIDENNPDSEPIKLTGVKFELRKKNDSGEFEKYGTEVSSDDEGKFSFTKLPEGEYEVWETKAKVGYLLPDDKVSSFKVDEDGKIIDILNDDRQIENNKIEVNLPITGGPGSLILVGCGVGLMILAILAYVRKKNRGR
ncbi:SpaA isopeptide-forming pilin-related protein [Anaerococcus sp. AGMB09787]|uniref:SpaA isopeptide-forming pilin-related protein n=1 Tax=Anaerococcus sp. AGMB09787 TaxID=2922869 RepID=UPI001FAFF698